MITNNTNVPLSLAVWLLHDEYDYLYEENYISATRLMKPLRQIILGRRLTVDNREPMDVSSLIPSALGKSLHDSIEKAWTHGHDQKLRALGYPEDIIKRVLVNPSDEQLKAMPNAIPVYVEQRATRKIVVNGKTYTIGGKYDMITEGIVNDNKSTSAYSWVGGGKDDDYALQGSIYRWLNPDKIHEDFIRINFIFTDWMKAMAKSNPNYPQSRLLSKDIPLLSMEATEAWIHNKLDSIERFGGAKDEDIPECTDKELWRSDPVFKYYSNPANTSGRATKNSASLAEAREYQASKGGKGVIIPVPGEPKRCGYCEAFPICKQKDRYFDAV